MQAETEPNSKQHERQASVEMPRQGEIGRNHLYHHQEQINNNNNRDKAEQLDGGRESFSNDLIGSNSG